ncbi:hypothetical protein ABPG75_010533, partial [Micractinium tetrahymenae]
PAKALHFPSGGSSARPGAALMPLQRTCCWRGMHACPPPPAWMRMLQLAILALHLAASPVLVGGADAITSLSGTAIVVVVNNQGSNSRTLLGVRTDGGQRIQIQPSGEAWAVADRLVTGTRVRLGGELKQRPPSRFNPKSTLYFLASSLRLEDSEPLPPAGSNAPQLPFPVRVRVVSPHPLQRQPPTAPRPLWR